ncbi:MAG: hypothetical protein HOV71_04285 [Hamadaea sp.]|nr:hypothetical protein [Hamadaea sp.]
MRKTLRKSRAHEREEERWTAADEGARLNDQARCARRPLWLAEIMDFIPLKKSGPARTPIGTQHATKIGAGSTPVR